MRKLTAIAAYIVVVGILALFAGYSMYNNIKYPVTPVESNVGAVDDTAATHWAEIDENGVVLRTIVASYDVINSGLVGDPNNWVATYENKTKRGNYAGKNYIYDRELDRFLPPKKYNSWVASTTSPVWEAPTAKPKGKLKIDEDWLWDETQENWVKINITNYASSTDNQQ